MRQPQFISTRDGAAPVSFETALLNGLAPDGGLYVPTEIPNLSETTWRANRSLQELSAAVLEPWLGNDVQSLVDDALSFPIPLVPLQGAGWDGISVLELFHGPTLSFKDVGARMMARLTAQALRDRDEQITILVATSGDTGSAVADGFAHQPGVRVVLLYPKGQVSHVQERQLIADRDGVTTLAVKGTFDDCQRLVKEAFAIPAAAGLSLSSANSINVGRLLPQMIYYPWALSQSGWHEAVFCVPSGNLGNVTAGVLTALAGLPVRRFVAAHNANDTFPRVLAGADTGAEDSRRTISNAMDVGRPSNLERLRHMLPGSALRKMIWGTSVSDAVTIQTMRAVYEATDYVADPHTAVGLEGLRRYRAESGDTTPAIVLATAHPAKFPEAVTEALGHAPESPRRLAAFMSGPTRVVEIEARLDALMPHLANPRSESDG